MSLLIRREDPGDARIVELLTQHLRRARAETAVGSAHALDIAQLRAADISFFAAWNAEALLGVGALKRLAAGHGEVKSMYTAQAARRRGVASAILGRLIAEARALSLERLSLETGSWDYFAPARQLYRRHGFRECAPFADYRPDRNSVFMTLELRAPLTPP
ncbi:MAG TPA: GNAT family N-acetyltransferase [Steroidobacteraceae bacterium]|nr:GNAT family N-acetyltransferase [Steroidobacteraceae bacterium]